MSYIKKILLYNFRNHEELEINTEEKIPILIIGRNGCGKTNLLEAISLISPGQGLRSAKFKNMEYKMKGVWETIISIEKSDYKYSIQTKWKEKKRSISLDQKICRNFNEISKIAKVSWFTPQMISLFSNNSEKKRKFFDRIVHNMYPDHASNIIKYNKIRSERLKLLKTGKTQWLSSLEYIMAKYGLLISNARLKTISTLNNNKNTYRPFRLEINGYIENLIQNNHDNAEANFAELLCQNRQKESIVERTLYGPHLTTFKIIDLVKNIDSEYCSTGEQKLLLISVIMSTTDKNSIILLDDVLTHLDKKNREILMHSIFNSNSHIWITNTDADILTTDEKSHIMCKSIE